MRRGENTQTPRKRPCDDRGGERRAAGSPGTERKEPQEPQELKAPGKGPTLERERERERERESRPCRHPDFTRSVSETVRAQIPVVSGRPVCGDL